MSDATTPITIRLASAEDETALVRLAALDSRPRPAWPVLLAEENGEARAALSLHDDGHAADPFHPTAELLDLLRLRARRLSERPARTRTVRRALTTSGRSSHALVASR
jgi:hypothetical protein